MKHYRAINVKTGEKLYLGLLTREELQPAFSHYLREDGWRIFETKLKRYQRRR